MKKIIIALSLVAFVSTTSEARKNKTRSGTTGNCSFATCTDHSYDAAYSSRWAAEARVPNRAAQRAGDNGAYNSHSSYAGYRLGTSYYAFPTQNLEGVVVRDRSAQNDGYVRPNPYLGDDAPSNDGHVKNEYRNMNVANTADVLPANDGMK